MNGGSLEPGPYIKAYNKNELVLTLTNGSEALGRHMGNIETVLSMNLGFFYLDQVEFVPEDLWLALEGCLRRWNPAALEEFTRNNAGAALPKHYGIGTGNPAPTWVRERFKYATRDGSAGKYKLYEAPTSANKENLPPGYEEELRASYPADWVARFLDGDWSVFEGQVYQEVSEKHIIEPFAMPDYWPRHLGWDHGTRNPTAVIWTAVDEDGNIVVYNEYYKAGPVLQEHAEAVKLRCEGDVVPRSTDTQQAIICWMDSQVAGLADHITGRDFRQLYLDYGIAGVPAHKQLGAGIGRLRQLLHPDNAHSFPKWHPRAGQMGSPRMFFFAGRCPALMKELPAYAWKKKRAGQSQEAPEEPIKGFDHALDAWRYAVMGIFASATAPKAEKIPTYSEWVHAQMMKPLGGETKLLETDPALVGDIW